MIVAFVNSKGGCGKTTLATQMAAWLQQRGRDVAVVDSDSQQATSTWLAECAPEVPVHRIETADDVLEQVPALVAQDIVCDGPAGASEVSRALLLVADLAIVPVCPSAVDVRAAAQMVRIIRQAQRVRGGPPKAMLVLNRAQARHRLTAECTDALAGFGVKVARARLGARSAFADSCGQGTVVWQMGYAARTAAEEIDVLFHEVSRYGKAKKPPPKKAGPKAGGRSKAGGRPKAKN